MQDEKIKSVLTGLISQPDFLRSVCDTAFSSSNLLGSNDASWENNVTNNERKSKRKMCTCASNYVHGATFIDRKGRFRNFRCELGLQSLIHDNSCPLSKPYPKTVVVTAALHNCGTILARAIRASITINRGAGGCSIAHTLDIARMVPLHSRAFQLVDRTLPIKKGRIKSIIELEKFFRDSVQELQCLFRNGSASPCDVNENEETLLEVRICVVSLAGLLWLTSFTVGCGR